MGAFAAEEIVIEAHDAVPFLGMVPVFFEVELANGQRIELSTGTVSGSPEQRMTNAQLRAKVADCLGFNQARVGTDELIDAVGEPRTGARLLGLLA